MAALEVVRRTLQEHRGQTPEAAEYTRTARKALESAAALLPASSALDRLCSTFGLSAFERDVLLLCAGMELTSDFATLCAAAQGEASRPYPTFSLALAALAEAHWSALAPSAPLRHWRLIELGAGSSLSLSSLRIDERVLHYLAGVPHLDERLAGLVEPLAFAGELVPSHRALAERIVATWSRSPGRSGLPVIQLCGSDVAGKRAIAASACAQLGLRLSLLSAEFVPASAAELGALVRLWEREAALSASALLLDFDESEPIEPMRGSGGLRFLERAGGPMFIASRERRRFAQRPAVSLDVHKPTHDEQAAVWRTALAALQEGLNGDVDVLASQFNLSVPAIQAASASAMSSLESRNVPVKDSDRSSSTRLSREVWEACRVQGRSRLDDLAQRVEPAAEWDDLVLPEPQRQVLHDIAVHCRQRARVYGQWGFAAKSPRGLGISALFSGASGTGKTLAAEVLARELQLDLYRIDLSQVVSKYIGETEKNLRRVFDAAEEGGAILLFDEADALFGKRSEVKDSHDRYANIEISYLLQRMETYRGLAILTTNLKGALDSAFLRRIRFIVQFPFPDGAGRAEIWRRIFPSSTPTDGLQVSKLSRLNVAGGNIRNIALHAAFLAADSGEPVRMTHLLRAARSEYAKLEKPLMEAETAGWL